MRGLAAGPPEQRCLRPLTATRAELEPAPLPPSPSPTLTPPPAQQCGYSEDRRPASNLDPYTVTRLICESALLM